MFTEEEMKAIGLVFKNLTQWEKEDVIGVLTRHGCFRAFPDDNGKSLVEMAEKIEACIPKESSS